MKKIVLDNIIRTKLWKNFLKENSNLYFYSKLKCTINTEEYLKTEKKSFKNRQLSRTTYRLRTSDHRLLIDTGRHTCKKVPQQQRLCFAVILMMSSISFYNAIQMYNHKINPRQLFIIQFKSPMIQKF